MAKPTPGPDFEALTDILRQLFATLSAPPPKPSAKALKGRGAVTPKAEVPEEDDEEEDEDEMPDLPMGMPMGKGLMGGKPMRRLTISILMPAKGLPPLTSRQQKGR